MNTLPASNVFLPEILQASTQFWKPRDTASQRRQSEEKHFDVVENFLRSIGFSTSRSTNAVHGTKDTLSVKFFYMESQNKVYKSLLIEKNGKKANILTLKSLLK